MGSSDRDVDGASGLGPRASGRRERAILLATAALAIGAPLGASAWVGARTRALAAHLGRAGGVPARIGDVDADLTGTIRLTDVAFGKLVSAEAVEASVSLESLLAGQLRADEIRVAAPRVAVSVDPDGDSDLARLVRRLARAGSTGRSHAARVRRIVVASGTLSARIAGLGELSAEHVELVPDAGGVRVITGRIHVRGGGPRIHGELELARSAAEVVLPHARFRRVLAVGGAGAVAIAGRTVALRDVAVGRLIPGGPLELRAALDDGGEPRAISARLDPQDLAVTLSGDRVPLGAFAGLAPHALELERARATGQVVVRSTAAGLELAVDGSVSGLRLSHAALAARPLPLAGSVRATLMISPQAIAVDDADLELGAAHWSGSGWLRRGSPASGQLDLQLASAPCDALLASLPAELRGPLDGMAMTGTFGGRAHLAIDLAAPPGDGVTLSTDLANGCVVTREPPAADVTTLTAPADMTFADGSHGRVGHGMPGWVDIHNLAKPTIGAFLAAEDARFYEHHGFDVHQIARSLEIDLRDRSIARGGSTISQQLVKNAFLTQRRSLDRKLQEAILTWRLEARLDKRTILERYLNVIELGPHVFGIATAARHWFGEAAHDLSIHQAAFLAALTAEPSSMTRRIRRAKGLDPASAARVDVVLRAMRRDGIIDDSKLEHARSAPLHFTSAALHGGDG